MSRQIKKRKHSYALTFAIIVMVGFFVFSYFNSHDKVKAQEQINNQQLIANKKLKDKNDELEGMIKSGSKKDYVEWYVREKFCFVFRGETVYVDDSTSDTIH